MKHSKQVRWINDGRSARWSDWLLLLFKCCVVVCKLCFKGIALVSGSFPRQSFCRFLLQEAMWVHLLCVLRCFLQCMAWCSVFLYSLTFKLSPLALLILNPQTVPDTNPCQCLPLGLSFFSFIGLLNGSLKYFFLIGHSLHIQIWMYNDCLM